MDGSHQPDIHHDMEAKIRGGIQAGSLRSDGTQLCDVGVLRHALCPSGQHSCRHNQRFRFLSRALLHCDIFHVLSMEQTCKFLKFLKHLNCLRRWECLSYIHFAASVVWFVFRAFVTISQRNILLALLVELIFMAAVVVIAVLTLHTTGKRSILVGMLCIIFNIAMYTSPLTIMVRRLFGFSRKLISCWSTAKKTAMNFLLFGIGSAESSRQKVSGTCPSICHSPTSSTASSGLSMRSSNLIPTSW